MLTDILHEVLAAAREDHRYVTDMEQYRRPEYWTIGLVGDCEDHALWCRQQLAARGIASDLIHCQTEAGEGHLVCSVDGWVLDNRHPHVMRRDELPYRWISIGRPDGRWYALTG